MATRHHQHAAAAPQPANRGAAAQKKAAADRPEERNPRRRALGDIGNLVHSNVLDGKIQLPEGINRPITRSFGAQLLKKAQANGAALAPPAAAPKPVARKPALRPEQAAKAPDANKKQSEGAAAGSAHKVPRKKVVNTLTAVLSHRSKEACGLNNRPKVVVEEDIDKLDGDNELAVVDYIEDIYSYYKAAQHESRPVDYMGRQPEIKPSMRAILVDWLVEVAHKFELMPETFYLTVYIIDMFLSKQVVPRRELQLVGVAAMLIACKYEEIWAPEVNDFIQIADNAYSRQQILGMEKGMLNKMSWNLTVPTPYVFLVNDFIQIADNAYSRQQILGMEKGMLNKMSWNLTVPTPYVFLVRFAKAAGSGDKELEHMVFFFAELALMEYGMVSLCPSLVAASAVYAARCTLKRSPIWTDTLKHHTGYSEPQLMETAKALVLAHAAAPQSKLRTVYKKYCTEPFGRVALRPPAVAA